MVLWLWVYIKLNVSAGYHSITGSKHNLAVWSLPAVVRETEAKNVKKTEIRHIKRKPGFQAVICCCSSVRIGVLKVMKLAILVFWVEVPSQLRKLQFTLFVIDIITYITAFWRSVMKETSTLIHMSCLILCGINTIAAFKIKAWNKEMLHYSFPCIAVAYH